MRYRTLLVLPWVLGAIAAVLFLVVVPHNLDVGRAWNGLVKGAAAVGAFMAFASYRRGDYMRVAWASLALSFVAISLRDFLAMLGLLGTSFIALNVPQIVSNAFGILAFAYFAFSFRVAGLECPTPRWTRILIYVVCAAIGVTMAGTALARHIAALGRTDIGVIGAIASDLGDLAGLILIAPMLLTAVALRGGLLGRPWIMLTTAQVCWLVYDLLAFADAIALREVARTLACAYSLTAGLAQRLVSEDAGDP
jgi:hypothetical protein